MPTYLRLGRLEVMLVRPMPLMLQLITADFQLRRLGRLAISVVIIFVVLPALHLEYTASTIYLLVITPFVGAAIYAAFFATAGGLQFFLINGAEFTSAFVYGGSYAGQLPGSVLIPPIRVLFTFVFPATVTAYLPALLIMGLPGPEFLPAWLGWFAPLFAAWAWVLAWLSWWAGMRRFTGLVADVTRLIASLAKSLGADRAGKPLPSSLARRRKACLLTRSSRTAARDPENRSSPSRTCTVPLPCGRRSDGCAGGPG